MKNTILLTLIVILFTSCQNQKRTHKESVIQYFNAFDAGNFEGVKAVVSDRMTIIEGPFVMPFSMESFHEHFKWDSVFKPSYEILKLKKEDDSQVIVTIAQENLRNAFLKNNPLKSQHTITFKEERISKMELVDYVDADFNIWQSKRDSLTRWIKNNHPALDGFVNELTMKGAQTYLKAIALYEER